MILDPLSELFHSSTCLQVLSGHAAFSVTSARCGGRAAYYVGVNDHTTSSESGRQVELWTAVSRDGRVL